MRLFLLALPLLLVVSACGMKKFEDVSHALPDGTTLEVRGQWAETLSQGYVGQETYRCGDDYVTIQVNSFGDRVVVEDISGCTQISSFHHADRGILRGTVETAGTAAVGGWFYMKGQEKRRPDSINIQNEGSQASSEATGGEAFAEGGQGGAGGAGGTAVVSVTNSNSQNQGQAQGQHQGQNQGQHQGNINTNVNKPSFSNTNNNVNVNKPTATAGATAISAPHITNNNKPTFNNNNKPVNVNVNKPTNVFKPTNNGGGNTHIGCRNNCFNTQGNSQGGAFNNNH